MENNVDVVLLTETNMFWGIVKPSPYAEEIMNMINSFIERPNIGELQSGFSTTAFRGLITEEYGHHIVLNMKVLDQTINLLQLGGYTYTVKTKEKMKC